jgi:L-serine dehydratase
MIPGIFNDVIGPVMRGPSSSHTAAAWRISRVCLDILNEPLKKAVVEFDEDGVWANNYQEQGTAMGINGGLLGLEITDPRMKDTDLLLKEKGISILYEVNSFHTQHVNTVRISLEGIYGNNIKVVAASLGGGSFEISTVDGFEVDIKGDYFELLILNTRNINPDIIEAILPESAAVIYSSNNNSNLINIKSSKEFPVEIINQFSLLPDIENVIAVNPILPIISGNAIEAPFNTIVSLLKYAEKENYSLGDIGLVYEKCLSGLSETVLLDKMKNLIRIIENSIDKGLEGTIYEDRILHHQSHLIKDAEKKGSILQDSILNKIISYVTAIMEVKSAMEVFVANPTAGSCGTVGGVLKAISDDLGTSKEELLKAYFAAGIVGTYIASGPGFSAEEHGCQVECGAASGMAAAAIVQLFGGTARQAVDAASMAIQNMLGLICDPVADRVEVPCLGKNVSAALNAYAAATMIRSGYNAVIPLNEVIQTVSQVSKQMPSCVKCTGKGGLALTKTALDLKGKLTKE